MHYTSGTSTQVQWHVQPRRVVLRTDLPFLGIHRSMEVYDELPPEIRKMLRESACPILPEWVADVIEQCREIGFSEERVVKLMQDRMDEVLAEAIRKDLETVRET